MAVRTFAELKAHFKASNIATAARWTDVIDTIEWIEGRLTAALAAASPVLVVADQAARLALGPTLVVGQMVKQTDDGVTYSLQVAPGDQTGQWVAVGDVKVEIHDVLDLQAQLNRRLVEDDDNTAWRLGVRQTLFGELPVLLDSGGTILVPVNGAWMSYADAAGDVTLTPDLPILFSDYTKTVSLMLYNPQLAAIRVTLPVSAFSQHIGNEFDLPSGKLAIITFMVSVTPTPQSPTVWITTKIEN